MEFIDELPTTTVRQFGSAIRQQRIAAEMRRNAGRWTVLTTGAGGNAYSMRKRWAAKFPDLEFAIRRVDGEYRLYARAVSA